MKNSYSDWFKVDLHIHTDFSNQTKKNDYKGIFSIDALKSKLIENEVKLFSLTDHNIINTDAYEEYYNGYSEGDPVLLLGCEFDIEVEQDDKSFLTYHTLLIFNVDNIEQVQMISCSIEDFFAAKSIEKKDRKLTIDQIFELFHKYHFFYIPHAGGHKDIISAHERTDIKRAQEMVLLMESAHEKVKEKYRQSHRDGFDKLKSPEFRGQKDIAFIDFSDNHNCNEYPVSNNGNDHEFYCLKGAPSFETIRFAFIDPESRIKKQSEVDKIKNVSKYISELTINAIENLKDTTIKFSPNLNAIIGGASSGKSLLFNLIGDKIGNSKNKIERYNKTTAHTLIKSSNSNTPQQYLQFDDDEVIYINQGDIVNYFEKDDLKDLIKESGQDDIFREAKEEIKEKKTELEYKIQNLTEDFDKLNSSYHKSFTIDENEIENMLSKKFHFIEVKKQYIHVDFTNSLSLIENIEDSIRSMKLDKNFEFDHDENEIIKSFIDILNAKKEFLRKRQLLQDKIEGFFNDIVSIVESANNNLESSSRAKSEAFRRKENLIGNIETLFIDYTRFYTISNKLENYNYSFKKEIEINDSVKLIMEVKDNRELKAYISNSFKDIKTGTTIFDVFIFLMKDNEKLKHHSYSKENLLKKLKRELEEVFNEFDSPQMYLDYGENGTSKDKSPGFNSEMYLKTILEKSNSNLVMIDQPEDNLGNTFKNETLIDILREYKFKKQIILVTHNPSIVVYGDAENIILAKNISENISYEQLVLENKDDQKTIIDNLDGGKVIFNMRSRKYNIKKLLNS